MREAKNEDAMDTAHQQAPWRQHAFAATIAALNCTRSHRSLAWLGGLEAKSDLGDLAKVESDLGDLSE